MAEHVFDVVLKITGDEVLTKNLEALEKNVRMRILKPAMKKGAAVVAREAKRRVPVRTGFLKKAIKPISTRRDASAMVVMNRKIANPAEMRISHKGDQPRPYRPAYIARIVERGAHLWNGGEVKAQPWLFPALEAKREAALDAIAREMRRRFGG